MARTDAAVLKQVRARVAAGAAFLDVLKPGWDDKIDLAKLDVRDFDNCVLGQLVGGYSSAAVGLEWRQASALGFAYDPDNDEITEALLTRRWRKVIEGRRG